MLLPGLESGLGSDGDGAVSVRFSRVFRVVGETAERGVRRPEGRLDATTPECTCRDSLGRGRAAREGGSTKTVFINGLGGGRVARSMLGVCGG